MVSRPAWLVIACAVGACALGACDGVAGDGWRGAPAVRRGGQTAADAIAILCGRGRTPPDVSARSPAERERELGSWLDREIVNPQVRALVATLAEGTDRVGRVKQAAAAVGIADCTPLALFGARGVGGADVPDVTAAGAGTTMLDQDLPLVAVTAAAIVVDGTPAAPAELEAAIGAMLRGYGERDGAPPTAVVVAVDRGLTYAAVAPVVSALARAGVPQLELAVGVGGETVVVPVRPPPPGARPIWLEVRMSAGEVVARIQPDVGVTGDPAGDAAVLTIDLRGGTVGIAAALHPALRELIERHGLTSTRIANAAVVAVDPTTPIQVFAEVVAAVRAAPDRTPLFPDVTLGVALPPPVR